MLDFTGTRISALSVHHVGNPSNDEELILSEELLDTTDVRLQELLKTYFLTPFQESAFHHFTFSNDDFKLNPIYQYVAKVFEDLTALQEVSVDMAKLLFELSTHPKIKSGDLFLAHFANVVIDEQKTEAVGIFKAENRQSFIKVNSRGNDFKLSYDDGINIEKLDKGCLILNQQQEDGYKVCVVDKLNKSTEALFWKESFLNLKPYNDEYHNTKDFLNITKSYVNKQLSEDFEVSRAEQIEILNKSMEYFKGNETFDQTEFEEQVFEDKNVIRSFRNYDQQYRDQHEIDFEDQFDISPQAVKRQERVFKTVLKLDKNFHVYIHGDRGLIEKGIDDDGRKYYKIFYDEES